MAGTTGLEPATSAVTGQRSNQLSYVPSIAAGCHAGRMAVTVTMRCSARNKSESIRSGGPGGTRTPDILLVRQAL